MKPCLHVVNSFNDLVHLVRDNYVFRGIKSTEHNLVPSVARLDPRTPGQTVPGLEEGIIRNFKKYAVETPADFRQSASHWDWLALAQHHNAPTRLLDWTWSPLVALYFS